jgi:SARP family transcriptional regulator, regulator of embCAB operon
MTTANLQVLGHFDVRIGGRSIPLSHDAQHLVALLALRRRASTRIEVLRAIWPCRTASRGIRDLRALYDALPDLVRDRIVVSDDGSWSLDDTWSVDLDDALEASRRLHVDPRPDGADLLMFRLSLLPGWTDDWLSDLQERYRRMRLSVLQRVGHHLLATRQTRLALEIAHDIVAEDGLREDGQHLLIAALAQSGRHDLAHQQFVRYRARLRHEWGVAPSPQLRELVSRAQHPSAAMVS